MNLFIFHPEQFIDDNVVLLNPRQRSHAKLILGANVGMTFSAGALGGLKGEATITHCSTDRVVAKITLDTQPSPKLPLRMLVGLPRPKMLKRILQTVTSLGVADIHLINSYKVEKSFWQTPWLRPDAIREQLLLGLEQAGDTMLPSVHLHKRLKPFVEDELAALASDSQRLIADIGDYPSCPVSANQHITLAIGPEGGFIPYEIDLFRAQGFQPVTLGDRILKVETAVTALTARLFT